MDNKVGSLYYDMTVDDSKLRAGLSSSSAQVGQFKDNVASAGDKIQSGLKTAAVALTAVGVGLTLYAKSATSYTEDLVRSSIKLGTQLGVSTTEASRLVAALGRMGISADASAQMFGIFEKNIAKSSAASVDNRLAQQKLQLQIEQTKEEIDKISESIRLHGDKTGALQLKLEMLNNTLATQKEAMNKSADAFEKLGVSTVDSAGKQRDFTAILGDVADKFKAMPNGIDKSALAMTLFGRSGKDMIRVLDLGSAGIQDLEKQADKLGLTLNASTISGVQKLIESQKNLKQQTDALKISVGIATAPALTQFNTGLNNIISSLMNSSAPIKAATTNILAFGGPVATAAGGFAGFIGNIGSAIPALKTFGVTLAGIGMSLGWVALVVAAGVAVAFLENKFHILSNTWKFVIIAAKPLIDFFNKEIKPSLDIVIAAMGDLIKQGLDQLRQAFDKMKPFYEAHKKEFQALGTALLVFVLSPLIILVSFIGIAVVLIVAAFNVIATIINWFVDVAKTAFHLVKSYWQFWVDYTMGTYNLIVGVVNGIVGAFNMIVRGAQIVGADVQSFFAQLPGKIMAVFSGIGNWLYNAGKDLIQGLVNGVGSMVSSAANAVKNVGNGMVNNLKNALGIKSPSTVFHEIGTNIGKGLMNGVNATVSDINASIGTIVTGAIAISPTMAALSNIGAQAAQPLAKLNNNLAGSATANDNKSSDASQNQPQNVFNNTFDLSGIVARSRSDLRDIAGDMIDAANEKLKAQLKPPIGGAAL